MFFYEHPHPAVTVDIAVFREASPRLEILLIERAAEPFRGRWALPGGFVGIDEGLEDAARRELAEETGLTGLALEQIGAFGDPGRDPRERVISITFAAFATADEAALQAGSDAQSVSWFSVDGLPALAFDHAKIIATALCHVTATQSSGGI